MVFNTPTDPILAAAFWIGIFSLLLTLLLGLQIVFMRMRLRRAQRIEASAIARWRPMLHGAIVSEVPVQLPVLRKTERIPFLRQWIYIHESVRGEAGAGLNDVALRLGCDRIAYKLLDSPNRAHKLLAIMVLGRLRDNSAWIRLQRLTTLPDSILSIYAYWALVRIDPVTAVTQILQAAVSRSDWPVTRLVLILQEAGDICAPAISEAIPQASGDVLARLLQIAEALHISISHDTLAGLLHEESPEILIASLKLVHWPESMPWVSKSVIHPDWRVRMQAAKALGRIGGPEQVAVLVTLLTDKEWWVRYRSAEALISLPFLDRKKLEAIQNSLQDRFAADIMRHVLTERGLTS